jgi:hypothetical protein
MERAKFLLEKNTSKVNQISKLPNSKVEKEEFINTVFNYA